MDRRKPSREENRAEFGADPLTDLDMVEIALFGHLCLDDEPEDRGGPVEDSPEYP